MKTLKHLCYTSHGEVMFRNVDDMNYAFNSLCSALYKTDSICLAEAFISTHHHGCYLTSLPRELMHIHRTSYTKYFNNKYGRTGSLGEKGFFMQEIDGLRHQVSAITYVLKNPVHHGISATPFAYPYCSANAFFRKDLGKDFSPRLLTSEQIRMSLPRRAEFDPSWKMGTEGVFLRESVLETAMVESLYSTPQAFNYMLSRKSGEDWVKEQDMDSVSCPPVTLENIESPLFTGGSGKEDSLFHMLQNERSRFNRSVMTDLRLCGIVDMELASGKAPRTVYQLSNEEKICLANELHRRFHCGKEQIRRCLAMND
ncbi:MAG: hypothetical protein IKO88_03985 [Bacteroidales bacterium]|nr:hypothetical protein [Bacteroidales bacterium]